MLARRRRAAPLEAAMLAVIVKKFEVPKENFLWQVVGGFIAQR